MLKKMLLIEMSLNFNRCFFYVILHLMLKKKNKKKTIVLNATIQYTFDANRFDVP